MLIGKRNPISIPPGVNKDDNAYTSLQWSDADKIRFYRGYPQKIGGWLSVNYSNGQTLSGVPRSIWSYTSFSGVESLLIGTNTRLYSLTNGALYNITPLVAATTAIANSLRTNYGTLGNNPITTTINTKTITMAVSPFAIALFQIGDIIRVTGVSGAVGGIAAADINGTFVISSVGVTTITYQSTSATNATSTATGGGNAVVVATRVIGVSQLAHGFSNGDRVKILASAAFGGLVAGDINIEAVIRNVSTNAYSYYSTAADTSNNFATSSVTAAGGAATTVQGQIAAGTCAYNTGFGYGGGNFGAGKYGVGKVFAAGKQLPTIWSFDNFEDTVVLTPGNQGALYQWLGDVATAPTIVSGAPSAINYVFVAENQIVTFGASGVVNRVKTSSTGSATSWTINATTDAYQEDITTSGRLLAHSYCKGQYILFTENSVHSMVKVGKPLVWTIKTLMTSDGLLSPKSATSLNDMVVWAGQNNFYIYNGAFISTIPNNGLKEWFFSNINEGNYYNSFVHKSLDFNELWWFAPFGNASEPNNYIIWNWEEGHFTNGLLTRTASEEPLNSDRDQYMVTGSCDGTITSKLYRHEVAYNYTDDGADMSGSLSTNSAIIGEGDYMQEISRIIPSNIMLPLGIPSTGQSLYSMNIYTKEYDGQQAARTFGAYPVTSTTQKIETRANGRQRQYEFTFTNQTGFRIEKFYEEVKLTTPR